MDPSYIAPFVKSAKNIFETMLSMSINIGSPSIKGSSSSSYDVSGIIGFSGDVEGTVNLSFPSATAFRVVSLFTGSEVNQVNEDLTDAVGELTNMIAGGAKAQFTGKKVSISCPSVVVGHNHIVAVNKDTVTIVIPCTCDCGEFNIEVSIRGQGAAASAESTAAAAAK